MEKPEQMLCDCEYQATKGNTIMCFMCSGKKPISSYGKPDNIANGECPNITSCLCITYEDCTLKKPVVEPSESQDETWEDVIERFNVEVADKQKTFVTATQLYKWLKINYTITRK